MYFRFKGETLSPDAILMKYALLTIIVVISLHATSIYFPMVNQEFAFADAAAYFISFNPVLLDQYFSYQANTLGLPYLTHLISNIFPNVEMVVLIRLVNLAGLPLLAIGIKRICNYLDIKNYVPILLLIVLNPLVWAFSGRATADFLPVAIGIFSISLALDDRNTFLKALVSGLFLGLAVILKYHSLSLLLFLGVLLLLKDRLYLMLIKLTIVSTITLIMLGAYLVLIRSSFGFWVTPEKYQEIHHLNISNLVNNFILYLGFLGLLAVPTFFLSRNFYEILREKWKVMLFFLVGLVFLSFNLLSDNGELNFGPLDRFINEPLRVIILSVMCLITAMLIFLSDPQNHKLKLALGLAILITLLVLSSSRPAQRYLLYVIPFFILTLPAKLIESKNVVISTIALFILVNIFIEASRWSTGTAANLMIEKLESENLIERTAAGAIDAHVGNKFFNSKYSPKVYIVVSGKSDESIYTITQGCSIFKKSFSLEKIK